MTEAKRNELYGLTIRLRKLTEAVRGVHNAAGLPLVLSQALGSLERAEGLMIEAAEKLS